MKAFANKHQPNHPPTFGNRVGVMTTPDAALTSKGLTIIVIAVDQPITAFLIMTPLLLTAKLLLWPWVSGTPMCLASNTDRHRRRSVLMCCWVLFEYFCVIMENQNLLRQIQIMDWLTANPLHYSYVCLSVKWRFLHPFHHEPSSPVFIPPESFTRKSGCL